MFRKRPHVAPVRIAIVLVLAALLAAPMPFGAAAQEATPATGAQLDLAAMPVTPAGLEAMGLPGFGRFFNGAFGSFDTYVEGTAGFWGKPVDEARALFERIGWSRVYVSGMGLPSEPGNDESPPVRGAYTNILELEDATGADDYFAFVGSAGPETEARFVVVEAPFALGERAVLGNFSNFDPETGETYHEYFVVFQVDNLFVDTGFWTVVPNQPATPVATPVTADAALTSPAATLDELEILGRRQVERVEAVIAGGAPNLSDLLLRIGDDPRAAAADYTEGYRLLDVDLPPYYGDREDDIIADPAAVTGADAVYELEENFRQGEEDIPGYPYFLTRLLRFPDEETAAAFMASRPDALATGGTRLVAEAGPATTTDLLPGEATDLGDQSLAFSFVRDFDGNQYTGYEVYVRVGAMVAAVSLEGPPDLPLAQVEELAGAQAACLEAGACPNAVPVPESFSNPVEPPAGASPAASPAG